MKEKKFCCDEFDEAVDCNYRSAIEGYNNVFSVNEVLWDGDVGERFYIRYCPFCGKKIELSKT